MLLNINKNSKEELIVDSGNVLSSDKYPISCVKKFKAHIKTYELKTPISLGQKMMFYLQGQKAQISIKKLKESLIKEAKYQKIILDLFLKIFMLTLLLNQKIKYVQNYLLLIKNDQHLL